MFSWLMQNTMNGEKSFPKTSITARIVSKKPSNKNDRRLDACLVQP